MANFSTSAVTNPGASHSASPAPAPRVVLGTLPIGFSGGLHVNNYHGDYTTGKTPAPIQAGRAYGPVSFVGNIFSGITAPPPVPVSRLANVKLPGIGANGYGAPYAKL
jgi:hypothetical protein